MIAKLLFDPEALDDQMISDRAWHTGIDYVPPYLRGKNRSAPDDELDDLLDLCDDEPDESPRLAGGESDQLLEEPTEWPAPAPQERQTATPDPETRKAERAAPMLEPSAPAVQVEPKKNACIATSVSVAPIAEPSPQHAAMSHAQLLGALGRLLCDPKTPFSQIRAEFKAIHFAMNYMGLMMPATRQIRKIKFVPSFSGLSDDDKALLADRQVIDLHWLWCRGWRKPIPGAKKELRDLLAGDEFDFDRAYQFAAIPKSPKDKVKWMKLAPEYRFDGAVLVTEADLAKRNRALKARRDNESKLNDSVLADPRSRHLINQIERWSWAIAATELYPNEPAWARRLHRFMEGAPKEVDRDTFRQLVKTVSKRITKIAPA